MKTLKCDGHITGLIDAVDESAVREQDARARSARPTGVEGVLNDASLVTARYDLQSHGNFEITDKNYHGVPSVVGCPEGRRSRNWLVAYYHTVEFPGIKEVKPHTSIYAVSPYWKRKSGFRQLAKDLASLLYCELCASPLSLKSQIRICRRFDDYGYRFLCFGSVFRKTRPAIVWPGILRGAGSQL